jgi:hypothetical protein
VRRPHVHTVLGLGEIQSLLPHTRGLSYHVKVCIRHVFETMERGTATNAGKSCVQPSRSTFL